MRRPSIPRPRLALLLPLLAAALGAACAPGPPPEPGARPEPETPGRWYWAYVANEASDVVSRVRFGPGGGGLEKSVPVGVMPKANDAPRGLAVSADGRHWYVTTAPGGPTGHLFKYETGSDRQVARVRLGSGPSSVALSADGGEAWVADPGSGGAGGAGLDVVATDSLRTSARVSACPAPRESRLAGDRAYVLCAGDDLLVEVDARSRRVRRALRLGTGRGAVLDAEGLSLGGDPGGADGGGSGDRGRRCRPSGLATRGDRLWVACAASDEVLEVGAGSLRVRRSFAVGAGPAALAVTPGGRLLLAANRGDGSVSVIDREEAREVARLPTSRARPRALAVTDDGRYVFVANGAGRARRSTVDVFDLRALARVAEVEVEHGARAVEFWRSAPARRP